MPQPVTTSPEPSVRLFIAQWPSSEVRQALLEHSGDWVWPTNARIMQGPHLHLTLHFIGAVPSGQVAALADALNVPAEPFELRLELTEVWRGGIAVLRPVLIPPPLVDLHRALGDVLRRMNLPIDARPFSPHVTLARRAQGAQPPSTPIAIRWPCRGHALVVSEQGSYRVLNDYGTSALAPAPEANPPFDETDFPPRAPGL
ncbi:MAG: RNA 2',3'-cyclic phosphodiesterase [Burkholderiales bacterium]|nr:RNA 2',3'-cyclic phosphodiesterase [Burkholderiales bacterium]